MNIKSVSLYKGRAYCVETDDGSRYYLHRDIISDFGICSGMEISEKKFAEVMEASYKRRAYERALYLLDYKDYSYVGMLEKLSETYPESISRETADRLAENGMLNDRRYAENLAERYCKVKKYGIYRAKQELIRKGIPSEIADEVLEEYADDVYENIKDIISRKYSDILLENPDRKNRTKVMNALVRLGYGYDDIRKATDEFVAENCEEDY